MTPRAKPTAKQAPKVKAVEAWCILKDGIHVYNCWNSERLARDLARHEKLTVIRVRISPVAARRRKGGAK